MSTGSAYLKLLAFCLFCSVSYAQQEAVPDPEALRGQIDALIRNAKSEKRKASLGLLKKAIDLSISYGAPIYNKGDHEACCQFYRKTTQTLCEAFGGTDATAEAARLLRGLSGALARLDGQLTIDGKAWTLRFAFDQVHLTWRTQAAHAQAEANVGAQYARLGLYEEAELAYGESVALLDELCGPDVEQLPKEVRFAAIGLVVVRFAQGKFKESAGVLLASSSWLPDWPTYVLDIRPLLKEAGHYARRLTDLEQELAKAPEDAALAYLLGHQYYFGGQPEKGQEQFALVLRLSPGHKGATAFLELAENAPRQKQIRQWIQELNAEEFEKRQEAEKKLEAEGRWAVSALKKSLTSAEVEVQTRARALLKRLGEE